MNNFLDNLQHEGQTRCIHGRSGDGQPAKIEFRKVPNKGIKATLSVGADDTRPLSVEGLTPAQAEALAGLFHKLA